MSDGPTPAILTGSQVYGTPTEASDIDLVVFAEDNTMRELVRLSGQEVDEDMYPDGVSVALRFGSLNLLICTHLDAYECWVAGTRALAARAPVTREAAVEEFQALRAVVATANEAQARAVLGLEAS